MQKHYSFYNFFGGFGLLLAYNLFIGFLAYHFIAELINERGLATLFSLDFWLYDPKRGITLFVLALQLSLLWFFCTQNQFIIVAPHQITFVNPLLPFIRTTRKWSDYDYYVTVKEAARGGPHEAVWLIKNGRIRNRISSFYYSNYQELESNLGCRLAETPNLGMFRQLGCLFGMKVS